MLSRPHTEGKKGNITNSTPGVDQNAKVTQDSCGIHDSRQDLILAN